MPAVVPSERVASAPIVSRRLFSLAVSRKADRVAGPGSVSTAAGTASRPFLETGFVIVRRSSAIRSASASLIIRRSSSALSRARRRSALASSLCFLRAFPTSFRSAALSLAKTKRSSRFARVLSLFSSAARRVCSRHSASRRASAPRRFSVTSRAAPRSPSRRRRITSAGSRNSRVSRSRTNRSSASRTANSFAVDGSSVVAGPLSRFDSATNASAADPRAWKLHASLLGSVSPGFASSSKDTAGAAKPTRRRLPPFAGDAPARGSDPVQPEPKEDLPRVTSAESFTKKPRQTRTRAHTRSRRVVARRTTTSRSRS